MKLGDLVRVKYPLPTHNNLLYAYWVKKLSLSSVPVLLLYYGGMGGYCKIYYDGHERRVSEDILEVVYER
tara:strand:+ start:5633 stop:5842 length:210 start_codon:yes stop_codon:yes gene_type:complete